MKKSYAWRYRILMSYKYDIILCDCGHIMELDLSLCFVPNRRISYG